MNITTKETYERSSLERKKEIFREFLENEKKADSTCKTYIIDLNNFGEKLLKPKNLFEMNIEELESIKEEIKDIIKNGNNRNTELKYIDIKCKNFIEINGTDNINPALKQFINFLKTISNNIPPDISDEEYSDYQAEIQNIEPATQEEIENLAVNPPVIKLVNGKSEISRNSRIAKKVLIDSNYTCQIDPTHRTFTTKQNKNYMEAHHLIPCSVKNSKEFYKKYGKNIDRPENIICICPTCHRAVHLGNQDTKKEKIKSMFAKQSEKLSKIGIEITEEDLLKRYYSPR